MSRILYCGLIMIMASAMVFAQTPEIEWETVIITEGEDGAINVYETPDDGYIVGGNIQHFGGNNQDIFFVKLNADGDTLWTKAWGDDDCSERMSEFIPTSDGGYIAVGNKTRSPYPAQYYLLKVDEDCDSVWAVVLGDPQVQKGAVGITEAYGGGYVFTGGCSQTDVGHQLFIIKTSPTGEIEWEKYYGLVGSDDGYSIIQADGGYVITGESPSFNGQEWNFDLVIMKTDVNGDSIWTKSYGGEDEERGSRIRPAADGGFIAAGYTQSFGQGAKDWYVVRTDGNGDSLWTRTFGNNYHDVAMDCKELPDASGFVAVGSIHYGQWDTCVLRLSTAGDSLWALRIGGEEYEIACAVEPTDDGGYIVCGYSDSYGEDADIHIIKLSPDPVDVEESKALPQPVSNSRNFPNPFNAATRINYRLNEYSRVKLEVYDITGRTIAELVNAIQNAGDHSAIWDADEMASGVYFYWITIDSDIESGKMVLLK